MRIAAAILCDAATVREGLLHLLGGGVTRIWRPEIPAALGVDLAVVVTMSQDEHDVAHAIRAIVYGPDMEALLEVGGEVAYSGGGRLEEGEEHSIPIVFPIRELAVARYGRHVIDLAIDDESHRRLDVWVLHPEELGLPPL